MFGGMSMAQPAQIQQPAPQQPAQAAWDPFGAAPAQPQPAAQAAPVDPFGGSAF